MPFKVWCGTCGAIIAKDVRFNAEKQKVGEYFSTPILSFKMIHLCGGIIEIRTDPKVKRVNIQNKEYIVFDGGKKKNEVFDSAMNETVNLVDSIDSQKLATNPFFRIEYGEDDKNAAKSNDEIIEKLFELNQKGYKDYYRSSKRLRELARNERKAALDAKTKEDEIKARLSISIDLLPETKEDSEIAKRILFAAEKKKSALSSNELERGESLSPVSFPFCQLKKKEAQLVDYELEE